MSENEPTEREKWDWEQRKHVAGRAHDREFEFFTQSNDSSMTNSNITLRTLVLINGAAALAILTFAGNLLTSEDGNQFSNMVSNIEWFVWGVALATFGIAMAYFVSYCITAGSGARERTWEHPYILDTVATKRWLWAARIFHVLAILVALASLGMFVYGMLEISHAMLNFTGK
ncbi:MAG: hypothetical protein ABJH63_08460 [Rhizobiaceae bacterium]